MDGRDIINIGMRPCIVMHKVRGKNQEKKAIFHMWIMSWIPKENNQLMQTLALVEYEDGTMGQVKPKCIRFTDNLVSDYFSILEVKNENNSEEPVQV